jgi:hypothetical protein
MSVRTWDAGSMTQNMALFIMMLFFGLLVLLGIATTGQWDLSTVFGIVFIICVLSSWVTFFMQSPGAKVHKKV